MKPVLLLRLSTWQLVVRPSRLIMMMIVSLVAAVRMARRMSSLSHWSTVHGVANYATATYYAYSTSPSWNATAHF